MITLNDLDLRAPGDPQAVTVTGDAKTVTGGDATAQWVMRCAVSNPGSLTHRPEFGAGLERYLQAPQSVALQQSGSALKRALLLRREIRRVEVTATPSPATAATTVSLEVSITTALGVRQLTVGI